MTTLIHADIFFFVTTIVVVVVGIALTVALVYLAKVLSDVRDITRLIKEETQLVRTDIAEFRADITREGFRFERLMMFFRTLFKTTTSRSKTSGSKKTKK